jgi:hypothetical protein
VRSLLTVSHGENSPACVVKRRFQAPGRAGNPPHLHCLIASAGGPAARIAAGPALLPAGRSDGQPRGAGPPISSSRPDWGQRAKGRPCPSPATATPLRRAGLPVAHRSPDDMAVTGTARRAFARWNDSGGGRTPAGLWTVAGRPRSR